MPAGTIKLTNNSTAVTGTGTSFTTELKANDFLAVVVGGVTYTLGVDSVTSNTALVLKTAYNGPTTASLAWTPIPNGTLVGITSQVAADVARAIRGLNMDKANWQQVFSGTGNITVNLPDGSSFTGPAWGGITTSLDAKMDKAQNLNDLANKATARNNLGLKGAAILDVGTSAGTVAAGNDSRLSTINNMTGGTVTGDISVDGNNINLRSTTPSGGWPSFLTFMAGQGNNVPYARVYQQLSGRLTFATDVNGTAKYIHMLADGGMSIPGNVTCASLTQTSDRNKKTDIVEIANALDLIDDIKGYTYTLKESGKKSAGIIAQEWQEVLPSVVSEIVQEDVVYDEEGLPTGEVIKSSSLSVDYSGVCAFLLSAARGLKKKNELYETELDEIKSRLKAIDGLDT